MSKSINEPAKKLPVYGSYDVVVIGGGIAGIAAAVAAARNGARTLLVEKAYALGGLATLGNVIVYLPLCDGMGRQVSFGIAEEMLKIAIADGSAKIPDCWLPNGDKEKRLKQRYEVDFNPASAMLSYESFVLDNSVKLSYDTRCENIVQSSDGRIEAVVLENKSGRFAIECGCVIDATGDADICHLAGEQTQTLNTNTAAGWFYTYGQRGVELFRLYRPFDAEGKVVPDSSDIGYDGTEGQSVTDFLFEARNMIRRHMSHLREERQGESIYPFLIPTFPGFRMTRRLIGRCDFVAQDRLVREDSIGLICDWRKKGPIYSVPFGSLCAVKTPNLFAVGRCMSAEGYSWDQSRVIPACAVTGQAAGTAAALWNGCIDSVEVGKLQATLRDDGVKNDIESI